MIKEAIKIKSHKSKEKAIQIAQDEVREIWETVKLNDDLKKQVGRIINKLKISDTTILQ